MNTKTKKRILLDTDVISHFIKGGKILILPKIFRNTKIILDIVSKELKQRKNYKNFTDNLINFNLIEEVSFTADKQILAEYAKLNKSYGKGESACMAYCKYNKDVLASSNLRDISQYCEDNEIEYVTTMDFLVEAKETKIMTEAECDEFIYNVKSKDSKLPVDTLAEYIEKYTIRRITN